VDASSSGGSLLLSGASSSAASTLGQVRSTRCRHAGPSRHDACARWPLATRVHHRSHASRIPQEANAHPLAPACGHTMGDQDPPRCPIVTNCGVPSSRNATDRRSMTLVTENGAIVRRSTHRHLFGKVQSRWASDAEGVKFECSACGAKLACGLPDPGQSWEEKVRK
jgi:hypothetical protein